jgi:hypothetical protein
MYLSSPNIKLPEDPDTIVWKYLDLSKFLDFLLSQKLFMSRSDKFEYQYWLRRDGGPSWPEGGTKRKFWYTVNHVTTIHLQDTWQAPEDPDVLFLSSAFSEVIFKRKKSLFLCNFFSLLKKYCTS